MSVNMTRAEEDKVRLVELRAQREQAVKDAQVVKEAKDKGKAEATARLAEKAAAKGKKGKGGGGNTYVKKEKEPKPTKVRSVWQHCEKSVIITLGSLVPSSDSLF